MPSVRRESRIASTAARRSPETSVRSDRLEGHVRAGSERESEIGLGQRGRVVHTVADDRDDLALLLEAPHLGRLSVREDACDHLLDPDLVGDRRVPPPRRRR